MYLAIGIEGISNKEGSLEKNYQGVPLVSNFSMEKHRTREKSMKEKQKASSTLALRDDIGMEAVTTWNMTTLISKFMFGRISKSNFDK